MFSESKCELELEDGIRNDTSSLPLRQQRGGNQQVVNVYSVQWLHLPSTVRNLSMGMRWTNQSKATIQQSIQFIYYKDIVTNFSWWHNNHLYSGYQNNRMLFKETPGTDSPKSATYVSKFCSGGEKTSFIFHGWTESCETEWVSRLMERLTFHRGGCIICVDYSAYSEKPYLDLVQRFDDITEILYDEMLAMIRNGLEPENGYMFGFSYGGQLASKIGRLLIHQHGYKFKQIDICDIAGPGFDFLQYSVHSEAAENVQCFHSSLDKGSHFRSCHQNILLGFCGYTQPAVLSQPVFSSHGLSVYIYINSFDYPFYALRNPPAWCVDRNGARNLPPGFKVGYKDYITNYIRGDIFVPTSLNYPYNLSKRELIVYEKHLNDRYGP